LLVEGSGGGGFIGDGDPDVQAGGAGRGDAVAGEFADQLGATGVVDAGGVRD